MCAARKSTTGCYAGGAGTATPSSGSPEDNQTEANNLDDNVQTVSRRSRSRKVRGKRRNTIAGIDQKEIQDAANGYVKINPNIDVYAELLASVFFPLLFNTFRCQFAKIYQCSGSQTVHKAYWDQLIYISYIYLIHTNYINCIFLWNYCVKTRKSKVYSCKICYAV